VGVEVVHHPRGALGPGPGLGDVLQEQRPVLPFLVLGALGDAPPGQWLAGHEDVAGAGALVLVVLAFGMPRYRLEGLAHLADQLPRRFVHADHRMGWVMGAAVDIEHLLHGRHEFPAGLRRDDPAYLAPGLECCNGLSLHHTYPHQRCREWRSEGFSDAQADCSGFGQVRLPGCRERPCRAGESAQAAESRGVSPVRYIQKVLHEPHLQPR